LRDTKVVQARGELELDGGELYFFALGASPDNEVDINAALTTARVDAVITVQFCFDEEGAPVEDSRCPVGKEIKVVATFTSDQPQQVFHDTDDSGTNVLRGLLASATASHAGVNQGPSIYGEIVENHTVFRQ
jgi:hypothetical protein